MDEFLLELQAKLDEAKSKGLINADIEKIQRQVDKLKLQAEIDPKSISNLVKQLESVLNQKITISNIGINQQQAVKNGQQVGQQIGNAINQGVSQGLSGNNRVLETFRRSLANIGMGSDEIDAVANRIQNLGVQIEALNQSTSHSVGKKGSKDILSVDISGTDQLGQAIKLTEQYNIATGELIKSMDSVSTAQQKAGTSTDTFVEKQKKAVSDITNQLNKIYQGAIDPNASKPIKDGGNLQQLKNEYNDIIVAIQKMGNASKSTFADEQNSVNTLISNLEIMVKQYKNAETVATSLRSKDIDTVKAQYSSKLDVLMTKMESSGVLSNGFQKGADSLHNMLDTAVDTSGLTQFLNGLDKLEAGYKRADAAAKAFNQSQKVGINVSGLESKIADLQRISPEIDKFETEINGVKVTVESLLNDLAKVNTHGDFSVVNSKWKSFTDSAKAAGIAVMEITTKADTSANKIKTIQDNLSVDKYSQQFSSLITSYERLGLTSDEIESKTQKVYTALNKLKENNIDTLIQDEEEFTNALKKSQNEALILKDNLDKIYNPRKQVTLSNSIQNWLVKNTAASKDAKQSLNEYYRELSSGRVPVSRLNYIEQELKKIDTVQRGLGKLGKSLKDQFSEATRSFSQWLSASSAVMLIISKTKNAISELKEVNTYLTEISKANDKLSKSDLLQIGNDSFDVASKYGKKATNYLSAVQEMSRAGYENAFGMAELSVAAQGAGDMTQELANQYIIATDKAYKLGGSVEKLTEVLDGSNYITNHNAVNMTELAEGMSIVGSQAASLGVKANETTAVLGTMIATTQQSGSEMARAFRAILLNLQQVTDEEEGITAEGLTKYEAACKALNVSLKETKNGITSLRDPMEVIKDLAEEYSKLDANDIRRTNLLSSVGGKLRANALNAILENYDMYEKMLKEYADGTGSMAAEAEKTANSWEGSLNRLSNTWNDTVENIANSDAIITIINDLNGLLSIVNNVTDKLGSFGTIGLGAGLFAGIKNVGMANYISSPSITCCLSMPTA